MCNLNKENRQKWKNTRSWPWTVTRRSSLASELIYAPTLSPSTPLQSVRLHCLFCACVCLCVRVRERESSDYAKRLKFRLLACTSWSFFHTEQDFMFCDFERERRRRSRRMLKGKLLGFNEEISYWITLHWKFLSLYLYMEMKKWICKVF